MNFAKNLKYLRRLKGYTLMDIAEKFGYKTHATVQKWETGYTEPSLEKAYFLSQLFDVSIDDMLAKDLALEERNRKSEIKATAADTIFSDDVPRILNSLPLPPQIKYIPVLGRISAGRPLYAAENIEGYMCNDLNHGAEYFGLRVVGDSMNAAEIFDGGLITVRKQAQVENGEIAVVLVDTEDATVKRYHRDTESPLVTLTPQSFNPVHKPQIYDLRKSSISILGKVVRSQIDIA